VPTAREAFIEYAQTAAPRLRRTAYLLCRDWELAADLTQITLTKTYLNWTKIVCRDNPDVFARKVLLRSFLDHQRRRSSRETVAAYLPETPAPRGQDTLRLTLMDALQRISPRDRAIVVLRYWEDYSVDTVAELLGVSISTVKMQSARTLSRLRDILGAEVLYALDD
jgi:RNA polymerase sigma-70 factor (sigma-E family)